MKFLIVDDTMSAKKLLSASLKKIGYNDIIEASNGYEALKLLESEDVNIIMSDLKMPGMNGLELLTEIRNKEEYNNKIFILVTAEDDNLTTLKAKTSGGNGYILKPYTTDILKEKLSESIANFKSTGYSVDRGQGATNKTDPLLSGKIDEIILEFEQIAEAAVNMKAQELPTILPDNAKLEDLHRLIFSLRTIWAWHKDMLKDDKYL